MNAIDYALAQGEVIRAMIAGTDANACEQFLDELEAAGRIFLGGAGRSLLSMKMFAMRLMQTNHTAYLVGEVLTPSIGKGDLLVVSSGRGETRGTLELVVKAKRLGARTALITGNPIGTIALEADIVLPIPPATAVPTSTDEASLFVRENLPGNMFETASLFVLDGLIARSMVRNGLTDEDIMHNHANLE